MAYRLTPVDWKEPSPQVEAGIERQACPGLCKFHEAVGIDTDKPRNALYVSGQIGTSPGPEDPTVSITFYPPDGYAWFHIDNGPAGGRPTGRLRFSGGNQPGDVEYMSITQDGKVGIGTTTPKEKLEVDRNILATGDVQLTGADCAENFEVEGTKLLNPGTVMVICREDKLWPCMAAYDKKVAGVLSGAGDCRPGIVLGKQRSPKNYMPLALTGRVYCQVDAQYSSIEVGDLLTTSPTPGYAMKASDPLKAFPVVNYVEK